MIKLDIISDVACPWCYLGKAQLDRALEARPNHPFQIEWHPYQLNPDLPREGMDRAEWMAARFGSPEAIMKVHAPLIAQGEALGVPFDFPAIKRTPNTLDAHRLIHWAGIEGRQKPMVDALFRAYWAEGKDIGDAATLADIAGQVGLDRDAIARLLATDADVETVRARMSHSSARGVSAVPTFIIDHRHVVRGAQPADLWTGVIDELAGARE